MSVLRLLVLGLAFCSAACGTSSGGQAPTQGSAGGGAGAGGGGGGGAAEPQPDAGSMPEAGTPVDTGSHVMTWVPPYRVDEAQIALQSDFGGLAMKDGISYLGLQFWIVDGPSTRLDNVTEADILWFRDWGKTQGVKV